MRTKQKAQSSRPTLLSDFYRSDVLPKITKQYSKEVVYKYNMAVAEVELWRRSVEIEEIDPAWLSAFKEYLSASTRKVDTINVYLRAVRLIVRQKLPYRFVAGAHWPKFAAVLQAEPVGCFGNYYVSVHEPQSKFKPRSFLKVSHQPFAMVTSGVPEFQAVRQSREAFSIQPPAMFASRLALQRSTSWERTLSAAELNRSGFRVTHNRRVKSIFLRSLRPQLFLLESVTAWAEDRATRGRDPSADPGAKTERGGDEVSTSHHLDFLNVLTSGLAPTR